MPSKAEYQKIYMRYVRAAQKSGHWYKGMTLEQMKQLESQRDIVVSSGRDDNPYLPSVLPGRQVIPTHRPANMPIQQSSRAIAGDQYQRQPTVDPDPATRKQLEIEMHRKVWEQENLLGISHTGGKQLPASTVQKIMDELLNIYYTQSRRETLMQAYRA